MSGDVAGPWAGCGVIARLFAPAALTLMLRLIDRVDATMQKRVEHATQIAALTDRT